MEWVEVRGEDVVTAEELALDQLGVAREDAEFEVVTAPENRWLGLKKTEARVRARVKPVGPRPKTTNQQQKNRRNKKNSRQKTQTANTNNKSQKNPEKQRDNKNRKDVPSKKQPVKTKEIERIYRSDEEGRERRATARRGRSSEVRSTSLPQSCFTQNERNID